MEDRKNINDDGSVLRCRARRRGAPEVSIGVIDDFPTKIAATSTEVDIIAAFLGKDLDEILDCCRLAVNSVMPER